ncbi:MAG: hypothetical protein LBJ35_04715, partial [Spirochaetaceae bacterium]|nr:hypothetical protein [Spirochaetaceae bacterium]
MNKPKTGIRRIAFFCLLFLPLSLQILAADESDPFYNELSFSLGADASGYSPTAFSLGGVFSADYRFLPFLAAGLNAGYGGDFDRLTNAGAQ